MTQQQTQGGATEAAPRAMEQPWKAAIQEARQRGMAGDLIPRYFFFEAGWNGRSAAEPSDAEVEAAAKAIHANAAEKFGGDPVSGKDARVWRSYARAALIAARKAGLP